MPPEPQRKSGYLPSLDGWRAIAILGVVMVHDLPWRLGTYDNLGFIRLGSFGVTLFFAISGILIPTRILEEEELTGAFHLRAFYIRRVLRIQPAALVYLAVIAILMLAGVVHEHWHYWLGALLLYTNFLYRETPFNNAFGFFTGHFWTLAVEEHFYLLISLLLFRIRRHRIPLLVGLLIVIKAAQLVAMHHIPDPLLRRTYWQLHSLLYPTLAAVLLRLPRVREFAIRWLHPVPILVLSILFFTLDHQIVQASLFFTLWVVATMLHARSPVTRLLETAPLRWLGRLSYSIYLWHALFFNRSETLTAITSPTLLLLSGRPAKYLATLTVATASYYWIEKPLMRLGHRLAPPATAGRRDLAGL